MTTKFNVGTLDPQVRELVLEFSSIGERPYETANQLAQAGLRYLGARLDEDFDLCAALGLTHPDAED